MIILEIILIPFLALALIGMVFIIGAIGTVDSSNSLGDDHSARLKAEDTFPVIKISYNDTVIKLSDKDPSGVMLFQADNQLRVE